MAGGLRQTDTAWNDGPKNLVLEEFPQIVRNLSGQIGPIVVHGEENSLDLQRMMESVADSVKGVH